MLVWWRTIFLMSVYSALACLLSLVCLLKQSWTDSKDFFTIFCWPDHHLILIMSADCLLGALLADLLISVVLFCQSLFGESVDVCLDWAQCFPCQRFLVVSISVCLKCFPASYIKPVWKDHLMSSWINPISFLSVSVWWVWSVIVWTGSHRFCLPMSTMKNLLMSLWTELACFPASIF